MRRRLKAFAHLRRRRGFTLLEALAAFAILTAVLAQLLSGVSGASRNETRADFLLRASRQGASQLEALGANGSIQGGVTEGRYDDGLRWRLWISPGPATRAQPGAPSAASYFVELVIGRPDGDGALTLNTMKIISTAPAQQGVFP